MKKRYEIKSNDYFSSTGANIGRLNAVNQKTLAGWQGATGQDANSVSVDPLFVSPTDFHLQTTSPVRNIGETIAAVPDDFDGQARPNSLDSFSESSKERSDSLVAAYELGGDGFYGYFSFDGIQAGHTYVLKVQSRKVRFDNPTLVLDIIKDISGIEFIASNP